MKKKLKKKIKITFQKFNDGTFKTSNTINDIKNASIKSNEN